MLCKNQQNYDIMFSFGNTKIYIIGPEITKEQDLVLKNRLKKLTSLIALELNRDNKG